MLKKLFFLIVFMNLATFFYAQERKGEAREYFQKGDIYYKQGKYEEAQAEYQKAFDILSQKEEVREEIKPPLEYVIGEEDMLNISVWQNPDLTQDVIVRPDGKISFPLVGDVQAVGLTITQLDNEITEKLKEYIKYPEVSVSIKKLGGKKVIVLGEVVTPGVYSVTGAKTILEAIGLAGGFTPNAVSSSVVVIRGGFTKPEAKRLNLTRALKGDLVQNISLQSEDVVFIPKKFIANLNYFLSQVLEPISKGQYTNKNLTKW